MQPPIELPDNLKSHHPSRTYFSQYSFIADNFNKSIAYDRLVLKVLNKDRLSNFEFKVSEEDQTIYYLTDDIDRITIV
jgi:hypothetical protein